MDPTLAPQPLERAHALDARWYVEPQAAEVERRTVFARSWQLVAHAGQLASAGDYATASIANVPLVLVRGDDGVLRAFHNVCRHRAGPLAEGCGHGARVLRCRYHGWTYGLDGVLRSATEMAGATDFDPSRIALPPARVEAWHGLVFAALGDAPPLAEVLAGVAERSAAHALADLAFERRVAYEVACNWKVYVDNFLEGYHLPHVHPSLNRVLDYRAYDTALAPWHSLQSSPIAGGTGPYGAGEALYWFVYPNTMLNVLPGRLQTNRVLPLAPDRCRVEFDYYYAPGADALREADLAFADDVQHEDIAICEAVQRGLASRSYAAGRLNPKRESGVHHFHELLRRACRDSMA